jgi:hypothetical protein
MLNLNITINYFKNSSIGPDVIRDEFLKEIKKLNLKNLYAEIGTRIITDNQICDNYSHINIIIPPQNKFGFENCFNNKDIFYQDIFLAYRKSNGVIGIYDTKISDTMISGVQSTSGNLFLKIKDMYKKYYDDFDDFGFFLDIDDLKSDKVVVKKSPVKDLSVKSDSRTDGKTDGKSYIKEINRDRRLLLI